MLIFWYKDSYIHLVLSTFNFQPHMM